LDSIINQTYENIEIILVDDGSKDTSGQICDEYASKDSRIRVIHKENRGVALARIAGFDNSKGELISFIDADDYIDHLYIEKLELSFEYNEIDLSVCQNFIVNKDRVSSFIRSVRGLLNKEMIKDVLSSRYLWDVTCNSAGLPIFIWGKMIRREYVQHALEQGKGLWWGEDQVASFYILSHINAMYVLSEPLYYYVKHVGQATTIYKTSLWFNQFECWRRYKSIDIDNLLNAQLPLRMWFTIKENFRKMRKLSYPVFNQEMKMIQNNPMWKDFLQNVFLAHGMRERVAFFLLYYKQYYFFYKFLLKKI
jgi:glycosyltransferase involved in cell wall biosynthesis